MVRSKHPRRQIFYKLVYTLLLVLLAVFLAVGTDWRSSLPGDGAGYDAGSWTAGDGTVVSADTISLKRFNGAVVLRRELPDTLSRNDSLCFTSNNARVTVWLDNAVLYDYAPASNLTGQGYGVAHHMVNLSPENAGKTVRIGAVSVFKDHGGGRVFDIRVCPAAAYVHTVVRGQLLSAVLSVLAMFFGGILIVLHTGLVRKNTLPYNLAALGVFMVLMGTWSLVDTGLPQLLTGSVVSARILDYSLLHLISYPLVSFVNSLTKQKRPFYAPLAFFISACCISLMLALRLIGGRDMHELIVLIYFSYFSPVLLTVIILVDNHLYCRRNGVPANLHHFAVGTIALILCGLADVVIYLLGAGSAVSRGTFLRFGLCFFAAELILQLLRWWSGERTSIERDRFINRLLQYAMSDGEPDQIIRDALEQLGRDLSANHTCIFEDMQNGTYDRTYEWRRDQDEAEADTLTGIPYEGGAEIWFKEYDRSGQVLIYDVETYRGVNESIYGALHAQNIRTMISGPLEANGKYIGFFCVDNPPEEAMKAVSEIIRPLSYFLSQLILRRNGQNRLIRYSYYDGMTGVKNRRAFDELEKERLTQDTPFGFVMCDINGLKRTNDTLGHDAGDAMIVDVASCLSEVFGGNNVYRLGGDEFAAFVTDTDAEKLANGVARARAMIDARGRSASFGHVYADGEHPSLAEAKAAADAQMYADKDRYYRGRNDRRQR